MLFTESKLHPAGETPQQIVKADRRRWASLIVLCAALFLEAMNLSSISVQIPAIRESLHLSTATAQFVVSAYLVTYSGFLLLGGLALAIILVVVFVVIEARVYTPMLPLGIFRSHTLVSANMVAFTQLAGFTSVVFISTLYLQNVLDYSPFQAGLVFMPMGIVAVIGSNLTPLLINRLGIKPMLIFGMFLLTAGIALTALISIEGTFWNIVLPSLLVGVGLSLAFPSMMIAAVADIQDADQGLASGLITTGQQLGGALGLALVTVVAAAYTPIPAGAHPQAQAVSQALVSGFRPALLLAAAFALLGTFIALVGLKGRRPRQPEQQMQSGALAENELPL